VRTYKIVKIDWDDSAMHGGWRPESHAREYSPGKCVSGGILVRTKPGSVGVTHSIGESAVCDTIVIPRKAIRSIEVLSTFKVGK